MGLSERFGGKVATAEESRALMTIGVTYSSVEKTLRNLVTTLTFLEQKALGMKVAAPEVWS